VLKYVEKSGVPIDMVVGTSIGSIVGGLYAMGQTSEQLDSLFRTRAWANLFTGSLMGDSIVRTLRDLTGGEVSFESLQKPFRCVAVDMNRMKEVVLKEGDLAQAMRASMAIPVVFKPVKIGNMKLVDGGVLNNLPVDVAREMGADYVIAVDLTVNKHENNSSSLLSLLRPDLKKYQRNRKDADIYINPNLKGYGAEDFMPNKIAEMIDLGEKAGKASLKEMKKLKKRLD
jgi:NTE family protein